MCFRRYLLSMFTCWYGLQHLYVSFVCPAALGCSCNTAWASAVGQFLRCLHRLLPLTAYCASVSLPVNKRIEQIMLFKQQQTCLIFLKITNYSRKKVQSLENDKYARRKSHITPLPKENLFPPLCMY